MIVVDASVLVNALADDDNDGDQARERLLAEALQCTLVTADHRLCLAPGPSCPVEQIGDS